jgi:hypothetical protein
MTLRDWTAETVAAYRECGRFVGTRYTAKNTLHSILGRVDERVGGWNIYEDKWDVCIVVDACRADLMVAVADDYEWLPDKIDTRRSVATATQPWMQRTFIDEYRDAMAETTYVVANPYSSVVPNAAEFGTLDEVHRYAWDEDVGTVRPRPVTERAIAHHRQNDFERLIVHYLPPYFPSIPSTIRYGLDRDKFDGVDRESGVEHGDVWDALRRGVVASGTVWDAYRENLRYLLDEIAVLRENIESERVVLTSDHGNAFGEWWTYGHPPNVYHPQTRRVPFAELTARDKGTLAPTLEPPPDGRSNATVRNRLDALGYT